MAYWMNDPKEVGSGDEDVASRMVSGARVRLSFVTWERLVGAVVLVALCVFFVDDPPVDDGTITLHGHSGLVECVSFSPDGQTLISSSWDRSVRVWKADPSSAHPPWTEAACLPSGAEMYGAAVSPDGETIASAGLVGVTLWKWRDSSALPEVKGRFGPSRAAAYAPDGQCLAVAGFDKRIRIWDSKADRIVAELGGHRDVVKSMTYVPDGSMLISQSFDGNLKFWDASSGREIDRLGGKVQGVRAFALSPDGRTIALSRMNVYEPRIEVWDLETDRLTATCQGHKVEVHTMAFSPDGRMLASAGGDQRIRFWNAENGAYAGQIDRPVGWVRSLDFSKDGRWIAYAGRYNTVHLRRIVLPSASAPTLEES